jgi:hypothetical protein
LAEVLAAARAWPLPAEAIAAIERLGDGPPALRRQ